MKQVFCKGVKSVAEHLRASKKKTQVIFAHNGVGKTRLSRAFKELATKSDTLVLRVLAIFCCSGGDGIFIISFE
jgi:ABC-type cobalamin/Fe3+-siderophores transport system ATPase subunit